MAAEAVATALGLRSRRYPRSPEQRLAAAASKVGGEVVGDARDEAALHLLRTDPVKYFEQTRQRQP